MFLEERQARFLQKPASVQNNGLPYQIRVQFVTGLARKYTAMGLVSPSRCVLKDFLCINVTFYEKYKEQCSARVFEHIQDFIKDSLTKSYRVSRIISNDKCQPSLFCIFLGRQQ